MSDEANSGETGLAEAVDWLGRPVSCKDCPHDTMLEQGRCDLAGC